MGSSEGFLDVLGTSSGHLRFTFDTEEDRAQAQQVIADVLKRGYSVFVETSRGLRKVTGYHAQHNSYIIKGGEDVPEAVPVPEAGSEQPAPDAQQPKRRGRKPKLGVPADQVKATAVAPTAGG